MPAKKEEKVRSAKEENEKKVGLGLTTKPISCMPCRDIQVQHLPATNNKEEEEPDSVEGKEDVFLTEHQQIKHHCCTSLSCNRPNRQKIKKMYQQQKRMKIFSVVELSIMI